MKSIQFEKYEYKLITYFANRFYYDNSSELHNSDLRAKFFGTLEKFLNELLIRDLCHGLHNEEFPDAFNIDTATRLFMNTILEVYSQLSGYASVNEYISAYDLDLYNNVSLPGYPYDRVCTTVFRIDQDGVLDNEVFNNCIAMCHLISYNAISFTEYNLFDSFILSLYNEACRLYLEESDQSLKNNEQNNDNNSQDAPDDIQSEKGDEFGSYANCVNCVRDDLIDAISQNQNSQMSDKDSSPKRCEDSDPIVPKWVMDTVSQIKDLVALYNSNAPISIHKNDSNVKAEVICTISCDEFLKYLSPGARWVKTQNGKVYCITKMIGELIILTRETDNKSFGVNAKYLLRYFAPLNADTKNYMNNKLQKNDISKDTKNICEKDINKNINKKDSNNLNDNGLYNTLADKVARRVLDIISKFLHNLSAEIADLGFKGIIPTKIAKQYWKMVLSALSAKDLQMLEYSFENVYLNTNKNVIMSIEARDTISQFLKWTRKYMKI